MNAMSWKSLTTQGKLNLIKSAWDSTSTGASIAETLREVTSDPGITRNSVLGVYSRSKELRKTHPLSGNSRRLGDAKYKLKSIREKFKALKEQGVIEIKEPPKPAPELPKIDAEDLHYDNKSLKKPLKDISSRECHWPVNIPSPGGEYLFCGHETEEGFRYCPAHFKRSIFIPSKVDKPKKQNTIKKISKFSTVARGY